MNNAFQFGYWRKNKGFPETFQEFNPGYNHMHKDYKIDGPHNPKEGYPSCYAIETVQKWNDFYNYRGFKYRLNGMSYEECGAAKDA